MKKKLQSRIKAWLQRCQAEVTCFLTQAIQDFHKEVVVPAAGLPCELK